MRLWRCDVQKMPDLFTDCMNKSVESELFRRWNPHGMVEETVG